MRYQFLGNVVISGKIKCETGLHIGSNPEGYEIGGMDNPVIKDPITGYPYIPGSSFKGKMRSMLEWTEAKIDIKGDVHLCNSDDCSICRIFGSSAKEESKIGPTRLLFRDAYPDENTRKKLDSLLLEKGLPRVEWKTENALNRINARATPRLIERVPKDSEFDFEIIYSIYQIPAEESIKDIDFLKYVFKSMRLLEDTSLGGYGSRGSGKVKFTDLKVISKGREVYESGNGDYLKVLKENVNSLNEIDEGELNVIGKSLISFIG